MSSLVVEIEVVEPGTSVLVLTSCKLVFPPYSLGVTATNKLVVCTGLRCFALDEVVATGEAVVEVTELVINDS